MTPAAGYFRGITRDEMVRDLQTAADRRLELINNAGNFLRAAFPNVPDSITTALAASTIAQYVAPILEQIEEIKKTPDDPQYTAENLIELTSQRDTIQDQITKLESAHDKLSQEQPGIADMMEATMMPVLRQQLAFIESQITQVHKFLEEKQST